MRTFEKHTERMTQILGLKIMPIGGKFSESPDLRGTDRKLSICEALDVVRKENVIVNISKENCVCVGGRYFAGLEARPPESIAAVLVDEKHKVYESKSIAEASVRKQPQPIYRGKFLILGPLGKFEADPDIVLFFVNPAQADRILGLASFKGAEPLTFYPATSICSTITHALANRGPDLNFISIFERKARQWAPDELIVSLPLKDFLTAVESINQSGFGELPTT